MLLEFKGFLHHNYWWLMLFFSSQPGECIISSRQNVQTVSGPHRQRNSHSSPGSDVPLHLLTCLADRWAHWPSPNLCRHVPRGLRQSWASLAWVFCLAVGLNMFLEKILTFASVCQYLYWFKDNQILTWNVSISDIFKHLKQGFGWMDWIYRPVLLFFWPLGRLETWKLPLDAYPVILWLKMDNGWMDWCREWHAMCYLLIQEQ